MIWTGNPQPTDILFYAVPVCAVQSYKYHVKVIPGTVKKGKGISFSHIFPSLGSYCSCYICLVGGGGGLG